VLGKLKEHMEIQQLRKMALFGEAMKGEGKSSVGK
jgi:hypothetical protein